jgi:Protein of unknown function (DUF664)
MAEAGISFPIVTPRLLLRPMTYEDAPSLYEVYGDVADVAATEQVWILGGWAKRFDLSFDVHATGFGHSSDDVAAVRVKSAELLTGYHDAVHEQTLRFVKQLTDDDLDRIVDESWSPPVTLGVRLVSVISDDLQHAGQAAFARGIVVQGAE